MRVTNAGARYAGDCRRILAEIDEAETAATGTHASPRGTLTLTAPVLFGRLHVTPVRVDHLKRFSEVDAQCLFLDRVVNLAEGLGITRLLSYRVAAQVRSGALQIVLQDFESAALPVHVLHHEGRRATQKVRSFIDLAVQRLRADPALD